MKLTGLRLLQSRRKELDGEVRFLQSNYERLCAEYAVCETRLREIAIARRTTYDELCQTRTALEHAETALNEQLAIQ